MARLQFWVCALAIIGAAAAASACRPGITQTQRTLLQRGLGSGVPLQAGNTYCGEMTPKGACGSVNTTSKPLKCTVGGKGTTLVYQPIASADNNRFDPENFDKTCLVNAGVACDHPANGDTTAKGKTDPQMACCSCFLYKKFVAGAAGQYVYNNDLSRTTTVHSLLMPTSACTGVENALVKAACPLGESIWDQGQADLNSSGKDKLSWGMAINPIFRRGQHQMHIHLAEVQPTLIDNIKYGFGKENRTSFYLNCSLTDTIRTMEGPCKVLPVGSKPDRHCPHVVISHKIKQPSQATPFSKVYGDKPDKSVDSVLYTSTLVIRLPGSTDQWATVTNNGPAECFFKGNGEGACNND